MVEHLQRRLQESAQPGPVVILQATGQMLRPMLGSSLATVVVFLPMVLLSGVSGGFFRALALTMSAALLVSLAVALLAVPLLTLLLGAGQGTHALAPVPWLQALQQRYLSMAERLLRAPRRVFWPVAVLGLLGAAAFWQLPTGFLPRMDEGGFILDYRAGPGVSLAETDRLLRRITDQRHTRSRQLLAAYRRAIGWWFERGQ